MAGFTNGNTGIASGGHQNTFGGGTYDSFLVKFDSTGTRLWSTYYGGSGNEGYDGNSVATDSQGNVYLTGWTSSSNGISSSGFQNTIGGGNDAFLAKFNPSGIRLWATYYGGTGSEGGISNILYGKNVAVDQTGNVFLSGTTSSTSSIASGGFQELYGGGSYDCYLAKFDSNGVRSWSTYYGGMGDDRGWGVATDQSGNAYLSGRTNSGANISSAGFQNSISGLSDAFLASFSTTGNRICATYFGGSSVEWAYTPAVDPSGNIYLPGFTASTNGIGSNGFQNVYASGTYDGFLAKFTPCGSSSINEQMNTDNSFSIFPNPISNQTTLTSIIELKNATITITDNLGNEVQKRNNINGRTVDINREFIASGIYFLKLTMDQKSIFTGKIVIID
jgi:hypothetical protein